MILRGVTIGEDTVGHHALCLCDDSRLALNRMMRNRRDVWY